MPEKQALPASHNTVVGAMDNFVPPHSIEMEMNTLGACLIEEIAFESAQTILTGNDFYRPGHALIWNTLAQMKEAGNPIDLSTLMTLLKERRQMETIGGPEYLTALFDTVPTAVNVAYYAQIVRDKAVLRAMITEALAVIGTARGEVDDVAAVLNQAQEKFFALGLSASVSQSPTRSYYQVLSSAYNLAEARSDIRAEGGNLSLLGVPTGLLTLDAQAHGLQRKTLTIVAARPSMGKSAMAVGLAEHAALTGTATCFFSLEMGEEKVGIRMLAGGAMVEGGRMISGECSADDFNQMAAYISRDTSIGRPLHFEFQSDLTIGQIRARARRLVRQLGIGLFVVDYLQLIKGSGQKGQNREQEVSEIVKGLKAMAKELDVAVVAVTAIGRGPESRDDKRPMLSDLRESGQIEFEADLVLMLYREDYYARKSTRGIAPAEEEEITHEGYPVLPCEIIIAKHRDGETGMVRAGWQPKLVRFVNLDEHTLHYLCQSNGHN